MGITTISYGLVDSVNLLPPFELEVLDADSVLYIERHVAALSSLVQKSPPARFTDPIGLELFESLRAGTDQVFVDAITTLAARVQGRMDGRMAEGLLVALRHVSDSGEVSAAVLKLDSTNMPAGYLRRDGARTHLAAIRDALDQPGRLQKGGLYPDPRRDSDVVIGDKIDAGTVYFVGALGLTQEQDPKLAVNVLLTEIFARVPDQQRAVAESIQRHQPTSLNESLDVLEADIPELQSHRHAIVESMGAKPRPIVTLSAQRAALLRREISGNGISIIGSLSAMNERVTVTPRTDGRYEATVIFDTQPADVTKP